MQSKPLINVASATLQPFPTVQKGRLVSSAADAREKPAGACSMGQPISRLLPTAYIAWQCTARGRQRLTRIRQVHTCSSAEYDVRTAITTHVNVWTCCLNTLRNPIETGSKEGRHQLLGTLQLTRHDMPESNEPV
jgi:hypothetical protein